MTKSFYKAFAFIFASIFAGILVSKHDVGFLKTAILLIGAMFCADRGWNDNTIDGLSDDINAIKKKLGLPVIARTESQKTNELLQTMKFDLFTAPKDFNKSWGRKLTKRYANKIKYWEKQAKQGDFKSCLSCTEIYLDQLGDTCPICNDRLDYWCKWQSDSVEKKESKAMDA